SAKEDCVYVVTFEASGDGGQIPKDSVIVRIENSFNLRNLTGSPGKTHLFRASITSYEKVGNYPRFTSFKVDGKEHELHPVSDGLSRRVPLPDTAEGRVSIALGMQLVYKHRDSESFITEFPIEGLHITV